MATPKILQLRDEIIELEKAKAILLAEKERLTNENKDLAESNTELRKRSEFSPSEYTEVEQGHIKKVEELSDEKQKIVKEKDDAEARLVEISKQLSDIANAIQSLEEKKKILEDAIPALVKEHNEIVMKVEKEKDSLQTIQKEKEETSVRLDGEIREKRKELREVILDTENRLVNVDKEERLIAIRQNDLEIYEKRLKAKYPDAVILPSVMN